MRAVRSWFVCILLVTALLAGLPLAAVAASGDACVGFGTMTLVGQGGEVYGHGASDVSGGAATESFDSDIDVTDAMLTGADRSDGSPVRRAPRARRWGAPPRPGPRTTSSQSRMLHSPAAQLATWNNVRSTPLATGPDLAIDGVRSE